MRGFLPLTFESLKLRLAILIFKFFSKIFLQLFLRRQSQRKRKFQLLKVNSSFSFFFDYSQFLSFCNAKCPGRLSVWGSVLLSVLTRNFQCYQIYQSRYNKLFLKNAQLCNKASCCIATKSRLTFLILARFFLSKNETGFEYFGHFFEIFLRFSQFFLKEKFRKSFKNVLKNPPKYS